MLLTSISTKAKPGGFLASQIFLTGPISPKASSISSLNKRDLFQAHFDPLGEIRGIYSGQSPHPGGWEFVSKLKNREEFEGGLEKRKGKGGKRRKKRKKR